MPYITQDRRPVVERLGTPMEAGELNYLVTTIVDNWLRRNKVSYASLNTAIGVLECAKLELYRRIAAPYEDKKCDLNGDVYICNR